MISDFKHIGDMISQQNIQDQYWQLIASVLMSTRIENQQHQQKQQFHQEQETTAPTLLMTDQRQDNSVISSANYHADQQRRLSRHYQQVVVEPSKPIGSSPLDLTTKRNESIASRENNVQNNHNNNSELLCTSQTQSPAVSPLDLVTIKQEPARSISSSTAPHSFLSSSSSTSSCVSSRPSSANSASIMHQFQERLSEQISSSNCTDQGRRSAPASSSSGSSNKKQTAAGQKGTKSHLCHHCDRAFSRSDMLTRHLRLHSGSKPYQCGKCLQVFSRSDHLSTHERTHTGEKPYQCNLCPYSACRRDMITRHMRTHTLNGIQHDESAFKRATNSGGQRRQKRVKIRTTHENITTTSILN